MEIEPSGATGGTIVWEWHIWDHLVQDYDPAKANYGVVADHPELVDLNHVADPLHPVADWTHVNSVDYHPEFDQILISVPRFSEVWVIDHSTTTEESAGHSGGTSGKGGDLLYRWGNSQVYDAGTIADRKFFTEHGANWIESSYPGGGHILIFNNGLGRPGGQYFTVDEFAPPVDGSGTYYLAPGSAYGPAAQVWIYTADTPTDFYSNYISGAQRFPNGNTLICEGASGDFFEVDGSDRTVWRYVNPVNGGGPQRQGTEISDNDTFRCYRYPPDYPGLAGHALTPQGPIELPELIDFTDCGDFDGDGTSETASSERAPASSRRLYRRRREGDGHIPKKFRAVGNPGSDQAVLRGLYRPPSAGRLRRERNLGGWDFSSRGFLVGDLRLDPRLFWVLFGWARTGGL